MQHSVLQKSICLFMALVMTLSLCACSSQDGNSPLSDPNEHIIVETTKTETILSENTLKEYITSENYLNEIILAEDKISELLLEENTINEVLLCKVIYVSQDRIDEFAANSQTSQLFGEGLDLKSILTKITIGSGVIVTLVVLKRVGLPDPIASVVFSAADKSLQFAENGALIGSLFGGLTGAANEIDKTGRTAAIIGFATATVGLILSIVSLVAEIPSSGSSTITVAAGVKLVIAGISVLTASAGTLYAGYNAVKTFTSTDAEDIDWDSIDWEKLGVSSAEQAIGYGADGYMWGSIVGAVYGGADGYEYYHKYNAPYTSLEDRVNWANNHNKGGHWKGEPGQSDYILDSPIELPDGKIIKAVTYQNGIPDFSPFAEAEVKIPSMTQYRLTTNGVKGNYEKADEMLAQMWTVIKHNGRTWTAPDIRSYREANNLSWHEMSNMEYMQLVPFKVNDTFKHYGGVAECKAMIGQKGETGYD